MIKCIKRTREERRAAFKMNAEARRLWRVGFEGYGLEWQYFKHRQPKYRTLDDMRERG